MTHALKVGDLVAGNGIKLGKVEIVHSSGLISVYDEFKRISFSELRSHLFYSVSITDAEVIRSGEKCIEEILRCKEERLLSEKRKQKERLLSEKRKQKKRLLLDKRKEEERLRREKHEREKKQEKIRADFLKELKSCLNSNYLGFREFFLCRQGDSILKYTEALEIREEFVNSWLKKETKVSLDKDQTKAVAHSEGNLLLTARAGSGKTRTLVTKTIFLLKHCCVKPRELLILAFNREAADEMKQRISASVSGDMPHVMTFHALGHAIVHPEEELIFDDADSNTLAKSRDLQSVIDELIRTKEYFPLIRKLMMSSFTDDWECIESGKFHLPMKELIAHRESLPRETLGREYVKSFGERFIANVLFRHNIEYKYERNFTWNGTNHRPDFTIQTGKAIGIIIEYFGMAGDPDYDEMSDHKRAFWTSQKGWEFLEYTPTDILKSGPEVFEKRVISDLVKFGIHCTRLSEEEIWEKIKVRAIDDFTKAVTLFIGRCRKGNLGIDELRNLVGNHCPESQTEDLFLRVAFPIYARYLKFLKENRKEDFDGMMWRAVDSIESGQKIFTRDRGRETGDLSKLRFVLIDEFQDFSETFSRISSSILKVNPDVRFFCVGDDWQAINSFAGSDLKYYNHFNAFFCDPQYLSLRTNYRSTKSIVDIGNSLMNGIGDPSNAHSRKAGSVKLADINKLQLTTVESDRHQGDNISAALLRLIREQIDNGNDVTLLSRRNGVPWYINYDVSLKKGPKGLPALLAHLRSFLPKEDRGKIVISTVHKYKGLESKSVIILDAVKRSYPLVHPNWIYMRIFGERISSITEEERRLFYVALSRPERSLVLLTNESEISQFVYDIERSFSLEKLDWKTYPPMPSLDGSKLEIRVHYALKVKDQLKDLGYRYQGQARYWYRAVPEEGFSWRKLIDQDWAKEKVRIEVLNEEGKRIYHKLA